MSVLSFSLLLSLAFDSRLCDHLLTIKLKISSAIMTRWMPSMILLFTLLLLIFQQSTTHAATCLHNERTKCTQVRSAGEVSEAEKDHCNQLCIRSGYASGHCSVASNCFQYCLCNEKEL